MAKCVCVLYTVGHSTRGADELVNLLAAQGVRLLVDVRSVPRSRRNPQFNRDELPQTLADAGVDYRHSPDLGGLRKPDPDSTNDGWRHPAFRAYADHMQGEAFAAAFDALLKDAAATPTAVMCAEALPWRCHRWLIADAAFARDWAVCHLMAAGKTQAHRLTSFAEVEDGRVTYPFALTGD